jgi:signal peptidase I
MAVAAKKRSDNPRPSTKNVVADARRGSGREPISWRVVWENVKSILVAVAIFLVIRTFLIEAYRIPSGSMIPTLLVGDWLFVNKLRFGPHIPFTSINLPGYAEPVRGDVVVFVSPPQDPSIRIGPDVVTPTLVKRVAGAPGDTLYMRNDTLYSNGVVQPLPFDPSVLQPRNPLDTHPTFAWQRRYELAESRFPKPLAQPTLGNWGPIVIPAGHFFMLGDNRHLSTDSRYYGVVPRENIRGRPLFVYYSFVPTGESDRALPFITDIRWGRIGHRIR